VRRPAFVAVAVVAALACAGQAAARVNPHTAGIQVALKRKGLYRGHVDGVAGPLTVGAVKAFQRSRGLTPDGLVGPLTRRALGRLGRPVFGRRLLAQGSIGLDVSVLQFLLARHGYRGPRLNGNFGVRTRSAVVRFQRCTGLPADGIVGPATRRALLGGKRALQRAHPPARRYVVQPGDTLTSIAVRSGTTVRALARANGLDPARTLFAGSTLRVPAAAASRPSRAGVAAALERWSRHYGVDPALARALAWQESGFQNHVRSPVGAWGVMQVTPATWEFAQMVLIGFPVPQTMDGNVRVGVAFLAHLVRLFRGNERLGVGAYYQGPASVRASGLFPETRRFVANVFALRGRI
jgi:peptidoglycan hydrolase-like protein with peptidoglycan-binding domain